MTTYYRFYETILDSSGDVAGYAITEKFFEDEAAAVAIVGQEKFGILDSAENISDA